MCKKKVGVYINISVCCFLCYSDSEESDDELYIGTSHCTLMHKNSLEEGILFELEREHQQKVKVPDVFLW